MSASLPAPWFGTERELTLEFRRLALCRQVSSLAVQSARVDVQEMVLGDLLYMLEAHILGQVLPPHSESATGRVTVTSPATWWQHLKYQHRERWWMRWLVRRRPPRMTTASNTVTVTATWQHMVAYPWAQYTTPPPQRLGQPVQLRWMDSHVTETPGPGPAPR